MNLFVPPDPASDEDLESAIKNWGLDTPYPLWKVEHRVLVVVIDSVVFESYVREYPIPSSMSLHNFPIFLRDSLVSAYSEYAPQSMRYKYDIRPFKASVSNED